MRLVDFLILLLSAHGQTLVRLAALLGEEELLEILEAAGEQEEPPLPTLSVLHKLGPLDPPENTRSERSAYAELESTISELGLSEVLTFHVWAYPHYRAYIESPIDLNSRIHRGNNEAGLQLAEEAIFQAKEWVHNLPLPPEISKKAAKLVEQPWIRFRTEVLTRVGRRPLGPVY
ncbi:hypothetical protein K2X30_05820 [bacterium]|jgi:hypothetical protein|nr:hypothetical protein [bacterium]